MYIDWLLVLNQGGLFVTDSCFVCFGLEIATSDFYAFHNTVRSKYKQLLKI